MIDTIIWYPKILFLKGGYGGPYGGIPGGGGGIYGPSKLEN